MQLTRLLALTALPERTNSEAQARGTTTPRGPRHRDAGATLSRGGGGGEKAQGLAPVAPTPSEALSADPPARAPGEATPQVKEPLS